MSQPEQAITPFQRMDGEPLFDEPWQAELLAMVDALIEAGRLSPVDWSDCLGAALKASAARGDSDGVDSYYNAALQALEKLLDEGGSLPASEVEQRRDDWAQAYHDTPHGKLVNLKS